MQWISKGVGRWLCTRPPYSSGRRLRWIHHFWNQTACVPPRCAADQVEPLDRAERRECVLVGDLAHVGVGRIERAPIRRIDSAW